MISNQGFTPTTRDAEQQAVAYIGTWTQTNQKKGGFALNTASYGAVWAGSGREGAVFGGGYSPFPAAMMAYAVVRLLQEVPADAKLKVYAQKELEQHVGPRGHVRWAMANGGKAKSSGKDYPAFEAFSHITRALDTGRWTLHSLDKDDWSHSRWMADKLAEGPGRVAALKHQHDNAPKPGVDPTYGIAVEG